MIRAFGTAVLVAGLAAATAGAQNGTQIIPPLRPAEIPASQGDAASPLRNTSNGGAGAHGFIEFEDAGDVRAGALIGSAVIDVESAEVGQVDDVIFDQRGLLSGLVISVGGFLGMGSKQVAVSIDRAKVYRNRTGDRFIVALDDKIEELELAPNFKTHEDQLKDAERAKGAR